MQYLGSVVLLLLYVLCLTRNNSPISNPNSQPLTGRNKGNMDALELTIKAVFVSMIFIGLFVVIFSQYIIKFLKCMDKYLEGK